MQDSNASAVLAEDNGPAVSSSPPNTSSSVPSSCPAAADASASRKGSVVVNLEKGAMGLGFAIQEGNSDGQPGIYIKTITPGGVAHKVRASLCLFSASDQGS